MKTQNVDRVDPNFRSWACSFSGCDGGDPTAPIWISGIEWGFGKSRSQTDDEYKASLQKYYSIDLPDEIKQGAVERHDQYDWAVHNRYRFGQSAAKLYLAMNKLPVESYYEIDQLPGKHALFKLNLYPIAFRYAGDSLWEEFGIQDITGMESKETYRTWCFLNRFPVISDLVRQHDPKLIVGMGITYLVDFFACFAGTSGSGNIHVESFGEGRAKRRIYWSVINDGRTVLAVLPFFTGSHGLNSNELIKSVGARLSEIRQEQVRC